MTWLKVDTVSDLKYYLTIIMLQFGSTASWYLISTLIPILFRNQIFTSWKSKSQFVICLSKLLNLFRYRYSLVTIEAFFMVVVLILCSNVLPNCSS